ncbi:hypothetical protein CC2G_009323 [Coprinopsis cinerea AmutBmut pab1-1]|nr:hypothetical protein CC2G_009323 [Coprinopsis cinerea AmutBmut pab1-1]
MTGVDPKTSLSWGRCQIRTNTLNSAAVFTSFSLPCFSVLLIASIKMDIFVDWANRLLCEHGPRARPTLLSEGRARLFSTCSTCFLSQNSASLPGTQKLTFPQGDILDAKSAAQIPTAVDVLYTEHAA